MPLSSRTQFRPGLATHPHSDYSSQLQEDLTFSSVLRGESFPTKSRPQLHSEICGENNLDSHIWHWHAFWFSLVTKTHDCRLQETQGLKRTCHVINVSGSYGNDEWHGPSCIMAHFIHKILWNKRWNYANKLNTKANDRTTSSIIEWKSVYTIVNMS